MKDVASIPTLVTTWCTLLVLLGLTTASAYINLGVGNLLLNLAIATAKVALIVVMFMRLMRASVAVRIAAAAALLFLFILSFLSFSDVLTRPSHPAPWRAPGSI